MKGRQIKRPVPGPMTVALVVASLTMGIHTAALARHQVLDINPHVPCKCIGDGR